MTRKERAALKRKRKARLRVVQAWLTEAGRAGVRKHGPAFRRFAAS